MGPKREFAVAAGVSFLCAFLLFASALLDPGRVVMGVDTATVQQPWASVIERGGAAGPGTARNAGHADHGMVFYPAYDWVCDSWTSGDAPLWNPLIYAGAPAVGNPQMGVLDPQVGLLALAQSIAGERARDYLLGWLVAGRLALALLGAYALARALGLGVAASALAAVSFGGSGFLTAWINFSLGHVAFLLPWVLLGIEGLRGTRPRLSFVGTALALALAVLGGHPETAFYVGATAGLWCLARTQGDPRTRWRGLAALALGTLLAAPSLLPFLEYLRHSGALQARGALEVLRAEPHWLALAALVLVWGMTARWQALERSAGPSHVGAAAMVLCWIAAAGWIAQAGAPVAVRLALWPRALGAPGAAGDTYAGPGSYTEEASAWLPMVVFVFALANLFSPAGRTLLPARRAILAGGVLALLLVLRVPGLRELYGWLPGIGLGATVRLAPVSALLLGLYAGEGLQRADLRGRVVAGCVAFGWSIMALVQAPLPPLAEHLRAAEPGSELFAFVDDVTTFERQDGRHPRLSGWVHPSVDVVSVRTRAERLDALGNVIADSGFELPTDLAPEPWQEGVASGAPAGARYFRSPHLWLEYLSRGYWRFSVDLYGVDGSCLATRSAGALAIERPLRIGSTEGLSWVWTIVALAQPVVAPVSAIWQAGDFARELNAHVPREEVFPPTATVEVLARELGSRRFLSEPGVLPANTGMVFDLADLDGYDGLDVASFNGYRVFALQPGAQPLLGWNARHMAFESPAFRLFGVGMLALSAPLEHPDWNLVAGPGSEAPEHAECWLYEARAPLPRAFCVARTIPKADVLADPAAFDPAQAAFLEPEDPAAAWEAEVPLQDANVRLVEWTNNRVEVAAELDGDGLLVLTEQYFPGWKVRVDGQPAELLRVDSIFRGVALGAGAHEVVFRYDPLSLRAGLWLAFMALGLLVYCTRRSGN